MISAWALTAILPLIGSNFYAIKRIEKLRAALEMREILLGDDQRYNVKVYPGGAVVRTFPMPVRRVRVTSSRGTELLIEDGGA